MSLKMIDLYLQSFTYFLNCRWEIISDQISVILNSNSSFLCEYLLEDSKTLAYPYICIKDMIDIMKQIMIQGSSDLFSGEPGIVSVPSIED